MTGIYNWRGERVGTLRGAEEVEYFLSTGGCSLMGNRVVQDTPQMVTEIQARMADDESRQAEKAVEDRARGTIGDLLAGRVGSQTVRDLGEAVQRATRDSGVARATRSK